MSKRGAEEYITKEHGSTLNKDTGESAVKMATAAQLAKRRMATPKSRLGSSSRTTQSSVFGAASSNPFSQPSLPQQSLPTFNGAVTFGQSQSFPPTQTSGGVNFQPPQSASFDFGTPSNTPNPFAGLNGNSNGGADSQEDMMMESPQKKPAFGGAFGQDRPTTNGGSGFSFGQPVQPPTGGLFGQASNPEQPKQNLFGEPAKPLFGGFSSPAASQPPSSGFGESTSAAPKFSFGQPQPPSETAKPGNEPDATVNGTGSHDGASPQKSKPVFSFGQPSTSAPSSNPFGGLSTSQPDEPRTVSNMFGQSASSQPVSNIFGKPPSAKTQQPPTAAIPAENSSKPFSSLFSGATPTSSVAIEAPKAPLFNFNSQSTSSSNLFGAPKDDTPKPNLFGTSFKPSETLAPSPPSDMNRSPSSGAGDSGKEKPKVTAESQPTAPSDAPSVQSPFKFGSTQSSSSGGLSSSASLTPAEAPKTQFSFGKPATAAASQPMTNVLEANRSTTKSNDLFGPAPTPSTSKPTQPERPGLQPGGSSGFWTQQGQAPAAQPSQPASNVSFSSTASTTMAPSAPALSGLSASGKPLPSASIQAANPATESNELNPKRPVYTKSPARIPPYLNGEGYKEYDNNYRLRSLNREFQKKIATLDPQEYDFENIVRHYVAARESIGASLGLYLRTVAGTKRKNDDGIDEDRDVPPQYKKARPEERQDVAMSNQDSGFTPSTSRQPVDNDATISEKQPGPSRSTQLFQSMIPGSPSKSTAQPKSATDSFASSTAVQQTNTALFGASKSTNSFAPASNTSSGKSASSTTPTKSPPKKDGFQMPKPAAFNFTNSFTDFAAKNAKKFEEALKEKRKADEFDSDEDDAASYDTEYEEQQRKKKAKYESAPKTGFVPSFATKAAPAASGFTFGSQTTSNSNQPQTARPAFTGFGGFKPSVAPSTDATPKFINDTSIGANFQPGKAGGASVEEPLSVSEDGEGEDEGDESAEHEGGDEAEDSEYQEEDEPEEDEDEDDLPEDETPSSEAVEDDDDDENDLQASMINANRGKSLFERIEPPPRSQAGKVSANSEKKEPAKPEAGFSFGSAFTQPAQKEAIKPAIWGSQAEKSTPEQPEFSPITPATSSATSKGPYKPAATFNFTPTPPTSTPTPVEGASIFYGGTSNSAAARFEGMFGSRPSTPSNIDKATTNVFGQSGTTTPSGDHTWKPGSAIKFGTPDKKSEAPTLSITSPSPSKEQVSQGASLGGLFGNSKDPSRPGDSTPNLGFHFGGPTSNPAPGYLGASSHLAGGSVTSSGFSSRATSPGLTDNESVATNETDDVANDPQTSLMESRAGEENEDCIWEVKAKALKFYEPGTVPRGTPFKENTWNTKGVGVFRVLKDKITGKTRGVLRSVPGASIIINEYLIPNLDYEIEKQPNKSGATKFPIVENGKLTRWVLKTKTEESAQELSDILEANKKN